MYTKWVLSIVKSELLWMNIHSHVVSMCKENLDYSTCVMIIYYNAMMSWWISHNSVSMILLSNQIKPMIEILI